MHLILTSYLKSEKLMHLYMCSVENKTVFGQTMYRTGLIQVHGDQVKDRHNVMLLWFIKFMKVT